jgi:hypothetical protein
MSGKYFRWDFGVEGAAKLLLALVSPKSSADLNASDLEWGRDVCRCNHSADW